MSPINHTPIEHVPEIEFCLISTQGIVKATCGKSLTIIETEDKPNHYNVVLESNGIHYQGQFDKISQIGVASRHPKHRNNIYAI